MAEVLVKRRSVIQGLSEEITLASENNGESFGIRKRNESKKQADDTK